LIIYRKEGSRKGKTDLSKEEFIKWTQDVWSISPETRRMHPAPFPEELARRVIKLFSFVGEVVCDPFVGWGTTCVAAKRLGRTWIGIDINPDYCKMATDRLNSVQRTLFDFC